MNTNQRSTQLEVARRWFDSRPAGEEGQYDNEASVQRYMLTIAGLFQSGRRAEARTLLVHVMSVCDSVHRHVEVPDYLIDLVKNCNATNAFLGLSDEDDDGDS